VLQLYDPLSCLIRMEGHVYLPTYIHTYTLILTQTCTNSDNISFIYNHNRVRLDSSSFNDTVSVAVVI
jgi:hypothetical protein